MTKLVDLFGENSKEIYRKLPIKDNKISEPFVYILPDSPEAIDLKIKKRNERITTFCF